MLLKCVFTDFVKQGIKISLGISWSQLVTNSCNSTTNPDNWCVCVKETENKLREWVSLICDYALRNRWLMYVNLPHCIALWRRHNSSCSPVLHTLSFHVMTSPSSSHGITTNSYSNTPKARGITSKQKSPPWQDMALLPNATGSPPSSMESPSKVVPYSKKLWHYFQMQHHP